MDKLLEKLRQEDSFANLKSNSSTNFGNPQAQQQIEDLFDIDNDTFIQIKVSFNLMDLNNTPIDDVP